MGDQRGGKREGAGRKKGSKNKVTVAREAIAEVLDAPDPMNLTAAIHQRGYKMLLEMERIVPDPAQPVAARIMAAKIVLPFMLPKLQEPRTAPQDNDKIVRRLQEGRARVCARVVRQTVECLEPAQSDEEQQLRGRGGKEEV